MDKEKDIQERVTAFKAEYSELIKKHEVDLVNYPMFVPNTEGFFQIKINTQIVDTKYLPTPSPLQKDKDIIAK